MISKKSIYSLAFISCFMAIASACQSTDDETETSSVSFNPTGTWEVVFDEDAVARTLYADSKYDKEVAFNAVNLTQRLGFAENFSPGTKQDIGVEYDADSGELRFVGPINSPEVTLSENRTYMAEIHSGVTKMTGTNCQGITRAYIRAQFNENGSTLDASMISGMYVEEVENPVEGRASCQQVMALISRLIQAKTPVDGPWDIFRDVGLLNFDQFPNLLGFETELLFSGRKM